MDENAVGSASNEPNKKVEAPVNPPIRLAVIPKPAVEPIESVLVVPTAEELPKEKPAGWVEKAKERLKRVQFISLVALLFAAAAYFFGAWFGLFWVVVALTVELGYWDDFKRRVKYGLAAQGRPNTAAAWGQFASKTGSPIA